MSDTEPQQFATDDPSGARTVAVIPTGPTPSAARDKGSPESGWLVTVVAVASGVTLLVLGLRVGGALTAAIPGLPDAGPDHDPGTTRVPAAVRRSGHRHRRHAGDRRVPAARRRTQRLAARLPAAAAGRCRRARLVGDGPVPDRADRRGPARTTTDDARAGDRRQFRHHHLAGPVAHNPGRTGSGRGAAGQIRGVPWARRDRRGPGNGGGAAPGLHRALRRGR